MIGVDDIVADLELAEIFKEGVAAPRAFSAAALLGACAPRTEELLLGDKDEALGREERALGELADGDGCAHLAGAPLDERRGEGGDLALDRDRIAREEADEALGLRA